VSLATEYFLLAFVCCLGVLQIVANANKLRGISFFKRPTLGYLFAALIIIGAISWFFITEDRIVPGLTGPDMALWFFVGASLAVITTLILSSLINRRMSPSMGDPEPEEKGLGVLKEITYFQAIRRHLRRGKQR